MRCFFLTGNAIFSEFFGDLDIFSWLLVASPQCFQASVGSHRSAEGEVTFRALLAALEENGEEARAPVVVGSRLSRRCESAGGGTMAVGWGDMFPKKTYPSVSITYPNLLRTVFCHSRN